MAIAFFINKRRVIPNWRSFKTTISLGELDATQTVKESNEYEWELMKEKIDQWHLQKNLVNAIELLNTSVVLGFKNVAEVLEAAELIKENPAMASGSLLGLANELTRTITNDNTPELQAFDKFEELEELTRREKVYQGIARLKVRQQQFPRNPIHWVEMARLYSIIGETEKASRSMRVAYYLAPENRFVLRAHTRLFVHLGEWEMAHDALRKCNLVRTDPWITSAEIALASLRDRHSRFVRNGQEMIDSGKFHPLSITELSSGIATLELESGSIKKSRNLFYTSLQAPNDNSLAQLEWAIQEEKKLHIPIPKSLFKTSYEALAYECYNNNDWNGVIHNCLKWFIDTPFAKTAMVMGHHVSSIFLKDYDLAIRFCHAGLISHPSDPGMLNNLAYSLACLNRTAEALVEIKKAEASPLKSTVDSICIMATRGLIHYRKKEYTEARSAYLEAMTEAKKLKEQYYLKLALLHFTREEVWISSDQSKVLVEQVKKLNIEEEYKDLNYLRAEILRRYTRKDSALPYQA